MQVYQQEDELIERWQWNDPALRNLSEVVLSLVPHTRGRALDLGCGSGRMAADLAAVGFRVDGIDVEERVIELGRRIIARRGLAVNLYAGDVFDPALPTSAGGYDLVVCTEVLEHVLNWRGLLARAGELLRPGGTLIVSVPRDPHQFSVLDSYAGHLRRFRDRELLDELRGRYEDLTIRRLGFPSMRLIVWLYDRLVRLLGRSHGDQTRSIWRAPGLPQRAALWLFYRLLKFDNLFADLPLGATLVVRARKRQHRHTV